MRGTLLQVGFIVIGVMVGAQALAGDSSQAASASAGQAGEVITLKIEGWTCASCEKDIRRTLLAVPGVIRAEVSYARGGAIVEIVRGRVSHDQLTQAVASAGNILSSYRASVVPNGTLTAKAGELGWGWNWFENLFK